MDIIGIIHCNTTKSGGPAIFKQETDVNYGKYKCDGKDYKKCSFIPKLA